MYGVDGSGGVAMQGVGGGVLNFVELVCETWVGEGVVWNNLNDHGDLCVKKGGGGERVV